ncbi:MAG: small, acid-soluble spore protein, alpha/beta type [bacterium]
MNNSYKYEVAEELGVNLGPDATARENGSVGGQITKELVAKGRQGMNIESMKYEFADELGVNMGPEATARQNGSVGGRITKELVKRGQGKY